MCTASTVWEKEGVIRVDCPGVVNEAAAEEMKVAAKSAAGALAEAVLEAMLAGLVLALVAAQAVAMMVTVRVVGSLASYEAAGMVVAASGAAALVDSMSAAGAAMLDSTFDSDFDS